MTGRIYSSKDRIGMVNCINAGCNNYYHKEWEQIGFLGECRECVQKFCKKMDSNWGKERDVPKRPQEIYKPSLITSIQKAFVNGYENFDSKANAVSTLYAKFRTEENGLTHKAIQVFLTYAMISPSLLKELKKKRSIKMKASCQKSRKDMERPKKKKIKGENKVIRLYKKGFIDSGNIKMTYKNIAEETSVCADTVRKIIKKYKKSQEKISS